MERKIEKEQTEKISVILITILRKDYQSNRTNNYHARSSVFSIS